MAKKANAVLEPKIAKTLGDYIPRNPLDLQPKGMYVLVRRLPVEEMTKGGLHLPQNQSEKCLFVEVIAKGEGRHHLNGEFQPSTKANPGDIAIVRQFAGTRIPDWMITPDADGKRGEYAVMNGQNIEFVKVYRPWPKG